MIRNEITFTTIDSAGYCYENLAICTACARSLPVMPREY